MKNKLVKGLNNKLDGIVKTIVHRINSTPNDKYIPSQKRIKALEIAYVKKSNAKVPTNGINDTL